MFSCKVLLEKFNLQVTYSKTDTYLHYLDNVTVHSKSVDSFRTATQSLNPSHCDV